MLSIDRKTFQYQFQELGKLGEGNYGQVFLVVDKQSKQQYAMKKIKCKDIQSLSNTIQELIYQVPDERMNIVKIEYYFIDENYSHYPSYTQKVKFKQNQKFDSQFKFTFNIIMEKGDKTLHQEILQHRKVNTRFPKEEFQRMLLDLTKTMAILEQRKINHRDIKPENIMKCLDGKHKLIDFGMATFYKIEFSKDYAGSDLFVSPLLKTTYNSKYKEFQSHNAFKSDVYSLGLTLLQAATLKSIEGCNEPNGKGLKELNLLLQVFEEGLYEVWHLQTLFIMTLHNQDFRPSFGQLFKKIQKYSKYQNQKSFSFKYFCDNYEKKQLLKQQQKMYLEQKHRRSCAQFKLLQEITNESNQNDEVETLQLNEISSQFQNENDSKINQYKIQQMITIEDDEKRRDFLSGITLKFVKSIVTQGKVINMIFIKNGIFFIAGYEDGHIQIFDSKSMRSIQYLQNQNDGAITCLIEYSSEQGESQDVKDQLFFSGSKQGHIVIWDFSNISYTKQVQKIENVFGKGVPIFCMVYCSQLNTLYVGGGNGQICSIKINPQNYKSFEQQNNSIPILGNQSYIYSLSLQEYKENFGSKKPKTNLIIGTNDGFICTYDLTSKKVKQYNKMYNQPVHCLNSINSIQGRNYKYIACASIRGQPQILNQVNNATIDYLDIRNKKRIHYPIQMAQWNNSNIQVLMENVGIIHFWDAKNKFSKKKKLAELPQFIINPRCFIIIDNNLIVSSIEGELFNYEIKN